MEPFSWVTHLIENRLLKRSFWRTSKISKTKNCISMRWVCEMQIWRIRDIVRSSHWRCSLRKGVLRNFAKFTKKARVSFSIKLQAEATNGSSRDTTNASNNATDDSSSPTTSAIDAITRSSITYISGVGRVTVLAIGVWSIFRI